MAYVQGKCPECGGFLPVDDSKKAAVCQFCGEAFIVQEAINNYLIPDVPKVPDEYKNLNVPEIPIIPEIPEIPNVPISWVLHDKEDFVIEDGVLKRYKGTKETVVIPDGVVELGKNCFIGSKIKAVVIPEGVKKIGKCAFGKCNNLKFVTIPSSVTSIEMCAFGLCGNLDSVIIPEGVTKIHKLAFDSSCELKKGSFDVVCPCCGGGFQLCSVDINEGTITCPYCSYSSENDIKNTAENCNINNTTENTLEQVDFVSHNGGEAISDKNDISFNVVESNEPVIEQIDFVPSSNANSDIQIKASSDFVIEGTVLKKYVGTGGTVFVPDGVTKIGEGAFSSCSTVTWVTLPSSVTDIGAKAFDTLFVMSVTIPIGVTHIGNRAFANCTGLKSISLPNVNYIGEEAFLGCTQIDFVMFSPNANVGKYAFAEYWEKNYLCTCCGGTLINKKCVKCGWVRTY